MGKGNTIDKVKKDITMNANTLSSAFTTNKVEESRDFYVKYFDAKVTFDCGWYVNLEFGATAARASA